MSTTSSKARKACKAKRQSNSMTPCGPLVAAGAAVVFFRLGGEGLYDKRRQDRGFGPKLGDVQW